MTHAPVIGGLVSSISGSNAPDAALPPQDPNDLATTQAQEESAEEKEARAQGMASTILTGPQGVQTSPGTSGSTTPMSARNTLVGT